MIYRGQVRDGVVVLPSGVHLPEGLEVTVEPLNADPPPARQDAVQPVLRNGVPIFPRNDSGPAPELELVNKLRDAAP